MEIAIKKLQRIRNKNLPEKDYKKICNIYAKDREVICGKCYANQMVPGTSSKFYCFSCQELNKCRPKYKFFRCGQCKVKVCYPWGYS